MVQSAALSEFLPASMPLRYLALDPLSLQVLSWPLAGLGVGGALGGLVGALVGMGIPEYEAKRYEGRVKDGGTLLSVHCDTSDEITRAKDMLKSTGADDISSTSESSSDSKAAVTRPAAI